jgi:hypothetical protein
MSHGNTPAGGHGDTSLDRLVSLFHRVTAPVRHHLREWPRRYVEMRTGRFD